MPPTSTNLIHHTRIDAVLWEESKYAYTKHTYYGWRKDPVEEYVWRREFKPIGAGGFGAVFREECIQGRSKVAVRAVKHIQKPTASQRTTRIDYGRELEAIARFSRPEYEPFFVQSEGWYEAEDTVCIVMELVQYGSLQDYVRQIQSLPEPEAQLIVSQTLQGIAHMHRAGYTHRDLKPQNLLVVQQGPAWRVKIADFGLSKRLIQDLSTVAGTAGYMAPEVLGILASEDDSSEDSDSSESHHAQSYTNAVDIWAVGVILFLLLTGQFPFPSHTPKLLARYVHGRVTFPVAHLESKAVSTAARDLVAKLLAPRPVDRPSAESCLRHNWLEFAQSLPPMQPANVASNPSKSGSWNTQDSGYQTGWRSQTASSASGSKTVGRVSKSKRVPTNESVTFLRERSSLEGPGEVLAMRFSPSSRQLLVVYKSSISMSSFDLWDVLTGTKQRLPGQTDFRLAHVSFSFSGDGSRLVLLLSAQKIVSLHDGVTGALIRTVVPKGSSMQFNVANKDISQYEPKGVAFMAPAGALYDKRSQLIYFVSAPSLRQSMVGVILDETTGAAWPQATGFRCDHLLLASEQRVAVADRSSCVSWRGQGKLGVVVADRSSCVSWRGRGKLGVVYMWSGYYAGSSFIDEKDWVEIHGLEGQVATHTSTLNVIAFFSRSEGGLSLQLMNDPKKRQDFECAVLPDRASPAGLAFSGDGRYIAFTQFQSGGRGKSDVRCLRIISVESRKEVANVEVDDGSRDVAFSPDGRLLAVGNLSGRITLYDVLM